MPELKFAITQQQKSVLTGSIHGPLTQVLATLAVLAEESPTQASFQHQVNPSCGLQNQLSLSEATGRTHRSRHSKSMDNASLIHSDIFIFIYDGDLPQSFQVPRLIENTMHTPVLRSHDQLHAYYT